VKVAVAPQGFDAMERSVCSVASSQPPTITWVAVDKDINIASFRYRCLMPAYALAQLGFSVEFTNDVTRLRGASDVLVFMKAFGSQHVVLAKQAKQNGAVIVVDICDNIFVENYSHGDDAVTATGFLQMAEIADLIVTSSNSLAKIVQSRVGDDRKISIIPDGALSRSDLSQIESWYREKILADRTADDMSGEERNVGQKSLAEVTKRSCMRTFRMVKAHVSSLPRRVARWCLQSQREASSEPRKRIVWFGKHGTKHSSTGIIALSTIVPDLIRVNEVVPLELVVISNNQSKFLRYLTGLPFPTYYRRWSNEITFEELDRADLVVLPNLSNNFVATKSANRALLAFSHGVPVVASQLDSLSELTGAIAIEDWEKNVLTYLSDRSKAQNDVKRARQLIEDRFSLCAIGDLWCAHLLEAVRANDQNCRRLHRQLG
jgi:hypothetical protein